MKTPKTHDFSASHLSRDSFKVRWLGGAEANNWLRLRPANGRFGAAVPP